MTTLRTLRRAATAALLLSALALPLTSATTAGAFATTEAAAAPGTAPARTTARPADVLEPSLPVQAFPPQVKAACDIWRDLSWPEAPRAQDYPAGPGLVIRGSNVYGNRSGDLPADGHYREYDVNPRTPGTHRDAERLIRDPAARTVWYTDDHYSNFREISSGCS
ncbi:ribonuclease domain-containing protein [Streptomyces sp. NPDC051567]|uniref:ribonuclease domain-containing protein n=1 Tax=Streptomyces sp. NPDC051567 TaxID=3365660 RepID=UPI0037AD584E